MNTWTDGYFADVDYTYGYHTEINPARINLAFLKAGLKPPTISTACELAFGQGLDINIHAAGSTVQWYGTDFNPQQVSFAQELAQQSGHGAQLFDQSFEAFCQRDDLPDFDYIAMFGLFSWISPQNQQIILDFIQRKLKVGGVVYINYNTLPGWSGFGPMRHLMNEYDVTYGDKGQGAVSRINEAMAFGHKLLGVEPRYGKAISWAKQRLEGLKENRRNYLAHEYFNGHWRPLYFAEVAQMMHKAKLEFACSSSYGMSVDTINLTQEQQDMLAGISDSTFRETTRDFFLNQQFRTDYWLKGKRLLTPLERKEALQEQPLVMTSFSPTAPEKVVGELGEGRLNKQLVDRIWSLLSDQQIHSLHEIESAAMAENDFSSAEILDVISVLIDGNFIAPVQNADAISAASETAHKLNAHLLKLSRTEADLSCLVSPVTGGGIALRQLDCLFILAHSEGANTIDEYAEQVWRILEQHNKNLTIKGEPLKGKAANIEHLIKKATEFKENLLPLVNSLKLI